FSLARERWPGFSPQAIALAKLHAAVEIRKLLAPFRPKRSACIIHDNDPVEPERAEAFPQFAPPDQRPDLAPEPQSQRANIALGYVALLVAIVEPQHAAVVDRPFQHVDRLTLGIADAPTGRVNFRPRNPIALRFGQNGAYLYQRLFRRARHRRATKGTDHSRSGDQSNDFIT